MNEGGSVDENTGSSNPAWHTGSDSFAKLRHLLLCTRQPCESNVHVLIPLCFLEESFFLLLPMPHTWFDSSLGLNDSVLDLLLSNSFASWFDSLWHLLGQAHPHSLHILPFDALCIKSWCPHCNRQQMLKVYGRPGAQPSTKKLCSCRSSEAKQDTPDIK